MIYEEMETTQQEAVRYKWQCTLTEHDEWTITEEEADELLNRAGNDCSLVEQAIDKTAAVIRSKNLKLSQFMQEELIVEVENQINQLLREKEKKQRDDRSHETPISQPSDFFKGREIDMLRQAWESRVAKDRTWRQISDGQLAELYAVACNSPRYVLSAFTIAGASLKRKLHCGLPFAMEVVTRKILQEISKGKQRGIKFRITSQFEKARREYESSTEERTNVDAIDCGVF